MRYLALASDYDGTLAHDGIVSAQTIKSLERFRHSGRKLIMVTGRELPDLESVFPRLDLFERVVAENGAVLYDPETHNKRLLGKRPPEEFIQKLRDFGVDNMSVGEVIVATWHPHEEAVLRAIRECGLEMQVIFNKDAVMVLPSGTNKMTGLSAALEDLKLSRHNVVGVGDAENDHAFLGCCQFAVAVSNAIPSLKEAADLVTKADRGDGVAELIEQMISDDLASVDSNLNRHGILLGKHDKEKVLLSPFGNSMLVCGQSGSGKSTFVAGFLEQLLDQNYQVCLIDPEGDYDSIARFVSVGDQSGAPSCQQVMQLLDSPESQVVVNLIGVKMTDRARYFSSLLSQLQEQRMQKGRPHWIIIDEAHHLLPCEWAPGSAELTAGLDNMLLITVHPEHVSPAALQKVNVAVVVGRDPGQLLREFAKVIEKPVPEGEMQDLPEGEALVWFVHSNRLLPTIQTTPGRAERHRHKRKYAEGELEQERVFYFRGPGGKLNLRAQNLSIFLQIAEGVDDETWLFHLKRGDYSDWFRQAIKDQELADEIEVVEREESLPAAESRKRIAKAIGTKYTGPA